jgi:hypothetical protein
MPQIPLILWIIAGLVPVMIAIVLAVEAWVVRPSIEDERRQSRPPGGGVRPRP